MRENAIVRLSENLFPKDAPQDELQWNNRIVRVKKLIMETLFKDNRIWRVEPLNPVNECDYIHVHQYEMSIVYSQTIQNMETDEHVPNS